jgi:hypothetical protein
VSNECCLPMFTEIRGIKPFVLKLLLLQKVIPDFFSN